MSNFFEENYPTALMALLISEKHTLKQLSCIVVKDIALYVLLSPMGNIKQYYGQMI